MEDVLAVELGNVLVDQGRLRARVRELEATHARIAHLIAQAYVDGAADTSPGLPRARVETRIRPQAERYAAKVVE